MTKEKNKNELGKKSIFFIIFTIIVCTILQIALNFNHNAWCDEIFSIDTVKENFGNMWNILVNDVHPPLYYIILKLITCIFNYNFFAFKMVSLLPIILNVIFISYITIKEKRINNKNVILLILYIIMTTLTSNFLWLGTELRMYSWAMLFVTISGVFAYKLYNKFNKTNFIVFILSSLAAALTHYWALIMECVIYMFLFVFLILKNRKNVKKVIITVVVTILGYIWWLPIAIKQLLTVKNDYWILFSFSDVKIFLSKIIGNEINVYISLIIIIGIVILAIYKYRKSPDAKIKQDIIFGILTVSIPFIIIIIGVLFNVLMRPIFIERYFIPCLGLFWLGIFTLLNYIDARKALTVIFTIILIYLVIVGYRNKWIEEYDKGAEDTVNAIIPMLKEDDILTSNYVHFTLNVLDFYFPNRKDNILKIEDINFETENRTIFYFEDNSNVIDKNNIIKNGYNIQKVYEGNIDIQQWNGLILDRYNFSVYKIEK